MPGQKAESSRSDRLLQAQKLLKKNELAAYKYVLDVYAFLSGN
jgi:hypothetical protein